VTAPRDTDDDLEELTSRAADEFMEGLGRGDAPDVEEAARRRPRVAAVLRRLLPALQAMHESECGVESPAQSAASEVERLGRLGDFEIVREVGRGGMGLVYEAVQLSLGRRVALKVLPFAGMLDPNRLQRFQNEARAAACLHHGNIVPVFAVGCDRGVHFYAMQFIEGRNLAALVRDARLQAGLQPEDEHEASGRLEPVERAPQTARGGGPLPAVTTVQAAGRSTLRPSSPQTAFRTAARLALQAAEALHHAHQQGVLHRDVKPANILVDAAGHVWVTDFGLAQVQSDPRLTTTGNLIGTLRYMSPEQAAGDQVVDHRTDIYSLGATLYEILALRPAFGGSDRATVLRRILHDEPAPLRRLNAAIPLDLETIVAKATAKSPADRYATAQALADDLRRFLEDRPILAKRPSLLEKAAKWARRRRGLVAGAIAVLLLAVCGLTTSLIVIARAYGLLAVEEGKTKQQEERAEMAYRAEAAERRKAEDAAWKARQVLSFFTQVTVDDFPDRPELRPVRRKLLEAALGYYQDFIEKQGDDPSVQAELVASRWHVASLLEDMGAKEEALAMFERVRAAMGPAAPGGKFWMGGEAFGVGGLLTQESVQKDLKLSDDQVRAIAGLAEKRKELAWGRRGPADEARRGVDLEANEEACFEVLRPEQARRMRQVIWQQRGAHVFADPDVADALGLTPGQRADIKEIEEESWKAFFASMPHGPGEKHPDFSKRDDFWKGVRDRLTAVLTDEQRAKWKEMTGEPFQGVIRFGPPPPGLAPGPPAPHRPGVND
jgi:serine/threonine protein kinase